MSHFDELMKTIKAAAFDAGIPALSVESGVKEDALRRLLSDEPQNIIRGLQRLEKVAEDRKAST